MEESLAKQLIKKMERDYDKIAQHFSRTRQAPWPEFGTLKALLDTKNNDAGIKILDIGCGNGRLAEIITQSKVKYTGLDLSAKLIQEAQQLHPETTFIKGSMLHLPFATQTFDIVVAVASLQHIPSEQFRLRALGEMYRVTKPQGYLFMINWNLYQAKLRHYLVLEWDPGDALIPWKNDQGEVLAQRYYHGFTDVELRYLLKAASWNLTEQYYSEHNMMTIANHG